MPKTDIEWCSISINPVKGLCPVDCKDNQGKSYCYARRMYRRFKMDETIRYEPEVFEEVDKLARATATKPTPPIRIFVGSTMELFGSWVNPNWMKEILWACEMYSMFTFIFLTKRYEALEWYSPYPKNCWVGVSVTNPDQVNAAVRGLSHIEAKVKFVSFEPLLGDVTEARRFKDLIKEVNWLIVGQHTPIRNKTMPLAGWVGGITAEAYTDKKLFFLKDNLGNIVSLLV